MSEDGAQLLEELMRFRPEGMTANAWAVRAGLSRTIWADLRRHGNPSRRTLSKLLEAAGSSLAEFEALRVGRRPEELPAARQFAETGREWRRAPLPQLPVLWAGPGGFWGDTNQGIEVMSINRHEVIDRLPRPPSLTADHGAYAVTVIGESMWPRFRSGRRVVASPAASADAGDDVLVLFGSQSDQLGGRALLKELVERDENSLKLRQFNPDITFELPAADFAEIHKVLGELI